MRFPFTNSLKAIPVIGLVAVLTVACGNAAPPAEPPAEASPAPTAERQQASQAPTTISPTTMPEENSTPSPVSSPTAAAEAEATEVPIATASPQAVATQPATPTEAVPAPDPTKVELLDGDDWEEELKRARISVGVWETDFSKRSVSYSEIFSGGVPRDGIPPIDDPKFLTVEEADAWLEGKEPVIALEIDGEAKAYPLQILTWHEIVNDTLAGVPVAATFCPLCNSAIAFDRRLDGEVYDFGVSGNLRNSDLIMWDRQTQSWWQQLTGEAIVGELTGARLDILPAALVAWEDFKTTYPGAQVLSRDTGHRRNYGSNPYVGYDEFGRSPFLFTGEEDDRLVATERVAAITAGDEAVAFPFAFLEASEVVHHVVGGEDLVVFFKPGARSALDQSSIASSREVGSTGVFLRNFEGQTLTFAAEGDEFVDNETGTRWNIFGQGVAGDLAGSQLTPVVHANHFWFAWAAFRPDTTVVREIQ